ncbi:MAG: cysteine--tRNA ligase [Sphingomonadales bacterium]|nr:cysteine--tRNA ligase [Sphingomonadales bacterium]
MRQSTFSESLAKESLHLYNTLSRTKEPFVALRPPHVGMYVCGPTVYGAPHLGHARPYVTFDVLNRYLRYLGYKVRYVRNITDVGHLVDDADEGEDKIARRARLEKKEPMELVQLYTLAFHKAMDLLGNQPPSIEPRASGHIPEQIEMIEGLIRKGFAYESNGSVYFDLEAYRLKYPYGVLSGRVVDELVAGAGNERRALAGQSEKRKPEDFALWKNAEPEHIMRWNSPWGQGFPGWHIECSAMGVKYLDAPFDIHGGGMDLLFPHHESEIAQTTACHNCAPCRYWVHNNMVTINGQKMGKSLDNFINLDDLFAGTHPLLSQAYDPLSIRFFILQAQYRSTLDFSDSALSASAKGYKRWVQGLKELLAYNPVKSEAHSVTHSHKRQGTRPGLEGLLNSTLFEAKAQTALNDDLNTPVLIALVYELLNEFQTVKSGKIVVSPADWDDLKTKVKVYVTDILGFDLSDEVSDTSLSSALEASMKLILDLRQQAKDSKNWAQSDLIRDALNEAGIKVMDDKEGSRWSLG